MKPDGSRPRVWLLKDDDFLRDMGETKLGSAPIKSKYEYQMDKLEWQLRDQTYNSNTIKSEHHLYTHTLHCSISRWINQLNSYH
jgi:hypothetical protein